MRGRGMIAARRWRSSVGERTSAVVPSLHGVLSLRMSFPSSRSAKGLGQRWAQNVPAQPLSGDGVSTRYADASVQVVPARARTPVGQRPVGSGRSDQGAGALPGALAEGDPSREGGELQGGGGIVAVGVGVFVDEEPPAQQHAVDAVVDLGDEFGDLGGGGRRRGMEVDAAGGVLGEGSVKEDAVVVEVEVEGRAEFLTDDHPAGLSGGDSLRFGAILIPAKDEAEEDLQDGLSQGGVAGEREAEGDGQRQDPLADGNGREDLVDEVGSRLRHPPTETRGTESSVLARLRHRAGAATILTSKQREAPLEDPAVEVVPEGPADEGGDDLVGGVGLGEEVLEVALDDAVEEIGPPLAGLVLRLWRCSGHARKARGVPGENRRWLVWR